jgi:flagellar hook-length control protein FliK
MTQFALDNLSSLASPSPTAGAASAPSSGSATSGFEDHLQRASQAGEGDPASSTDSAGPNPFSSSKDPASNDSTRQPARDAITQPSSQSPAEPTTRSPSSDKPASESATSNDPLPASKPRSPKHKRDAGQDSSRAAAGPSGAKAANTEAAALPTNPALDAKSQTPTTPTATPPTPPATGKQPVITPTQSADAKSSSAQQPTGGTGAPQQPAGDGAANAAGTPPAPANPDTTLQSAASQTPGVERPLPQPQGNVADRATSSAAGQAASAANASIGTDTISLPADHQAPGVQDSSAVAPDAKDSPRPARDANSTQHPTSVVASADAQAVAAALATNAPPADSPATDSAAAGSPRKDGAAPAIDGVAAKSSSQPVGQAAASTSAPAKGTAGAPSTTPSSSGSTTGEVDRVRFLQRVSSAFQAADDKGGQIKLRLSPPELGSMRLELTVRDGVMTAHVQTETDAARTMLLDHLPQLRDRLADHNIKIDQFDVELMNQSRGGTPQNPSGSANPGYQPPQGQIARVGSAGAASAAASPSASLRNINGRLDVFV